MPKKFMQSALTGCYFKVLSEGYIRCGDTLEITGEDENKLSVKDLFVAYYLAEGSEGDKILERSLQVAVLSPSWRAQIEKRLGRG